MKKLVLTSILLGLLSGAVTYTFQPSEGYYPSANVYFQMGLLACVSTLLAGLIFKKVELVIPIYVCIGFISAVFGRIAFDGIFVDPTSHNLWPFEILLIAAVVVPSSFIGLLIAFLIHRKRKS